MAVEAQQLSTAISSLGWHLLAELSGCECLALSDMPYVRETMLSAARKMQATIVGEAFYRFSPQGVSGVVLIGESHLSIHTWPEAAYAATDFYTCGKVRPWAGVLAVAQALGAKTCTIATLLRGRPEDLKGADRAHAIPIDEIARLAKRSRRRDGEPYHVVT